MKILINLFCLLKNGFYAYEYMDNWKRFDETSLPDKKEFCSSPNMEDIIGVDYRHEKRVFKYFNNKNLDDYQSDVQSDTLLLADVFESFRSKVLKICELDPAQFLSLPGLAWQTWFKKTEIKLELLNDIDMLLIVEKKIRGGICQAMYRFSKANNKYMTNYNKNKKSSYVQYFDENN